MIRGTAQCSNTGQAMGAVPAGAIPLCLAFSDRLRGRVTDQLELIVDQSCVNGA
jgi:hypothetical protein